MVNVTLKRAIDRNRRRLQIQETKPIYSENSGSGKVIQVATK